VARTIADLAGSEKDWENEWEKNSQRSVKSKLLPVDFRSPLAALAQSN
jgi:hypothetical protein